MRIVKLDELQFLFCVKNKVWGSNRTNLKNWENDSLLIFKVDNQIAGLAKITGNYYSSEEIIWDNDLYKHRRPLKFLAIFKKTDRVNFNPIIKNILIKEWGKDYGHGIINAMKINPQNKELILAVISKKHNSVDYINNNVDVLSKIEMDNREKEEALFSKGLIKSSDMHYKKRIIDI